MVHTSHYFQARCCNKNDSLQYRFYKICISLRRRLTLSGIQFWNRYGFILRTLFENKRVDLVKTKGETECNKRNQGYSFLVCEYDWIIAFFHFDRILMILLQVANIFFILNVLKLIISSCACRGHIYNLNLIISSLLTFFTEITYTSLNFNSQLSECLGE